MEGGATAPMTYDRDVGRDKDVQEVQWPKLREMIAKGRWSDRSLIILRHCAEGIRDEAMRANPDPYAEQACEEVGGMMQRFADEQGVSSFKDIEYLEKGRCEELGLLINRHLKELQMIGPMAVQKSDDDEMIGIDSDDYDWTKIADEGQVVIMVGANRSGKSNLMMEMSGHVADYGGNLGRVYDKEGNEVPIGYPIVTNQRLYGDTLRKYKGRIFYKSKFSEMILQIGMILLHRHSLPRYFKIFMMIDELDKIINTWSQMSNYVKELFTFFNQMGKFKLVFIGNWKNYRHVNVNWRDAAGGAVACKMFKGGKPSADEKSECAWIDNKWARKRTCYIKKPDGELMITGIPDCGSKFFHGAPAVLVPDLNINQMLNDLETIPTPKNQSHDEDYYRKIGQMIVDKIDEWVVKEGDEGGISIEKYVFMWLSEQHEHIKTGARTWEDIARDYTMRFEENITGDALRQRYKRLCKKFGNKEGG